jgi:hypothetical protein
MVCRQKYYHLQASTQSTTHMNMSTIYKFVLFLNMVTLPVTKIDIFIQELPILN